MCIVETELDFGELFSRGSGAGVWSWSGMAEVGLGRDLSWMEMFLFLENWAAVTDGRAEVVGCIWASIRGKHSKLGNDARVGCGNKASWYCS